MMPPQSAVSSKPPYHCGRAGHASRVTAYVAVRLSVDSEGGICDNTFKLAQVNYMQGQTKMRTRFGSILAATVICVAGGVFAWQPAAVGSPAGGNAVVSPDGRNEMRFFPDRLAYEVLRDGAVVVAKTEIGMTVDGKRLNCGNRPVSPVRRENRGTVPSPVYKKSEVDLSSNEAFFDFGDWGIRLVARNDGVAYRFETKFPGRVKVDCEKAPLHLPSPDVKCWGNQTPIFGRQGELPFSKKASEIDFSEKMLYLPFAYTYGGKFVLVTESDVRDYPIWNFGAAKDGVMEPKFAGAPKKVQRTDGFGKGEKPSENGGRFLRVKEHAEYLAETEGTRTFPWRAFLLADTPARFCEADLVWALAAAQDEGADFSWVKPGKVAWDWWNCFDNGAGCNTKTYERFIDFAAANGLEYVVLDEGWSDKLDIWKNNPAVDVQHIIEYGAKKGVDIILWMTWARVMGDEDHVAEHFAKLGAKGFKIDFLERGDVEVVNFIEKFTAACARNRMVVLYHGSPSPTGLHRRYPNLLNYEGIHGLEYMKWFAGGEKAEREMMFNDVAACFLRMSAGPMDYTPGAMLNHGVGSGHKGQWKTPGSIGTRCRQLAMMALYEAPLQMLCDSPTNYEKNRECLGFMAKVPTVWKNVVGLGGSPDTMFMAARETKDGAWYAGGLTTIEARDCTLDTSLLGSGRWTADVFRDAGDAKEDAQKYIHETKSVTAGEKLSFHMAPGGGFIVKFTKGAENL